MPEQNIPDLSFNTQIVSGQPPSPEFLTLWNVKLAGFIKRAMRPFSGFGAPVGTLTRTGYTVFTAPAVSNPPTQAEVQAIANHVQVLSERLAAVITDGS